MDKAVENSHNPVHIVQFTDTHFFEFPDGRLMGVDTSETFAEVTRLSVEQRGTPDFYLLTGDLSQDETAGSYRRFAQAMSALKAPAYFLPGNHDRRLVMRQVFNESGAGFRHDRNFVMGAWQIILLDTLVETAVGGALSAEELSHLATCLEAHPHLHTLIAMHHHPVPMGSAWIDEIGVENAVDFWRVVDKYPQVKAVLWGHVHQQFDASRRDVKLLATPSTCVQFKPRSPGFAADPVPPGYRWIELMPDGRINTSVERAKQVARGLEVSSAGY